MSKLQFEEDAVTGPQQIQKGGRITKWLMAHSFGLIKTEQQATIVQIVIILIGVGYVFWVWPDNESTIQLPSDELINSPQYPPNYELP